MQDMRQELHRYIERADERVLKMIYGMYQADREGTPDLWETLGEDEKKAIDEAIAQVEAGEVLSHEEVMDDTRKKYPHLFKREK